MRWQAMARHLRELGHSVTLVASNAWGGLPNDPDLDVVRVPDLRSPPKLRFVLRRRKLRMQGDRDHVEGSSGRLFTRVLVPETNVATWVPQATLAVRRLLSRRTYDCLVTSSPPESSHLIGLMLGRDRPAWLADFRDGWNFEPYRIPFSTGIQRRLDLGLEARVARSAEVAVGATGPIADDLLRRLGAFAATVRNGWDPFDAPVPTQDPPPQNLGRVVTLVYTGTLTVRGDPEPLLRALSTVAAESDPPRVRLLHAGRLTTTERKLIDESGASSVVEHLGTVGRAEALALQRSADALVLLTSRNTSEATGKLFEYLFAGRPIIALAEDNEAARIIQETNTGITIPPEDADAIAAALRKAVSGELAHAYSPRNLDRYEYPRPALEMADLVEEAIRRRAGRP